jgi:hypothetical protein
MNKLNRINCFIYFIAITILFNHNKSYGNDDLRKQILSQYSKAYSNLIHYYTNIDFKLLEESYLGKDLIQVTTLEGKFNLYNYIYTQQSRLIKASTKDIIQNYADTIFGGNQKYGFKLSRRNNVYVLLNINLYNIDRDIDRDINNFTLSLYAPLADTSHARTLLDILEDVETTYISFEDAIFHGLNTKKLTLEISYINFVTKKKDRSKVNYHLLPERNWICIGSTYTSMKSNLYVDNYIEYESHNDYPIPIKIEQMIFNNRDQGVPERWYKATVSKYERMRRWDASECTLSAFGLPEPVGLERPVRWWLWAGVAGVLLILLGAVFFLLAHRRRQAE